MGEHRYYKPMSKEVYMSTTAALDMDFIVPEKVGIKLLQLRGMLYAAYTGTFSYYLYKGGNAASVYSQKFDIGVSSDNIYNELNLICEKDDVIHLATSASLPTGTHGFELCFGGDGS